MIKEVTMYTVVCDNCGRDVNTGQEYSCWSEKQYTIDSAIDSGWIEKGDSHYCDDCFTYDDEDNLVLIQQPIKP